MLTITPRFATLVSTMPTQLANVDPISRRFHRATTIWTRCLLILTPATAFDHPSNALAIDS